MLKKKKKYKIKKNNLLLTMAEGDVLTDSHLLVDQILQNTHWKKTHIIRRKLHMWIYLHRSHLRLASMLGIPEDILLCPQYYHFAVVRWRAYLQLKGSTSVKSSKQLSEP